MVTLNIPLPPSDVQQEIADVMNYSNSIKKQKEAEAQACLDSINDYLLGALGIAMPEVDENTLDNRKFYVHSNKVIGGRFDPKNYTKKYADIFNAIDNSKLSKVSLRSIIVDDVSGSWGLDETEEDETLIKCLTIRATEFDNRYNLKLDNSRAKYRKYTLKAYERMNLTQGDILIEKSGGSEDQPVGRVAIIEDELLQNNTLAFSNFIHKIVVDKSKALTEYVYEYLTLMHNIKVTEVMQNQTNGIRNLIMGEYFSQPVLLPNKDKQKEIAAHIKSVKNKAKELENEAATLLYEAKRQVEKILLGEE